MDSSSYRRSTTTGSDIMAQAFINKVYLWMTMGLAVTGAVSYYVTTSRAVLSFLFGGGSMLRFWILVIAELGIVMYLSARIMTLNPTTASALFFAYAVLNGVTLSPIFLVYTQESLASAFFTAAATFGAMSIYGAVTKRDLSGWGSFLMMGLIGLIIANIINMFFWNDKTTLVIAIMGVLIFTGLTAYDTQKIRTLARELSGANENIRSNIAVIGALNLYLDFINLFLYLLRIFGKRK